MKPRNHFYQVTREVTGPRVLVVMEGPLGKVTAKRRLHPRKTMESQVITICQELTKNSRLRLRLKEYGVIH